MMWRMWRMLFLFLLFGGACSEDRVLNPVAETSDTSTSATGVAQPKLTGVSYQQPKGKRIVFVGYRADIKQQMLDSLSGVALDGPWYRAELPDNDLPGPGAKTDYSFKTQGVKLVVRKAWLGLTTPGEFYWTTEFVSGSPGTSGELSIMGPSSTTGNGVDSNGSKWTIGFDLHYSGIVLSDVKGETRETDLRLTVAAPFGLE